MFLSISQTTQQVSMLNLTNTYVLVHLCVQMLVNNVVYM